MHSSDKREIDVFNSLSPHMVNEHFEAVADAVKQFKGDAVIEYGGKKYLSFEALSFLATGMHVAAAKADNQERANQMRHAASVIESIIS